MRLKGRNIARGRTDPLLDRTVEEAEGRGCADADWNDKTAYLKEAEISSETAL